MNYFISTEREREREKKYIKTDQQTFCDYDAHYWGSPNIKATPAIISNVDLLLYMVIFIQID